MKGRLVAKRLFGDLGRPMAVLASGVTTSAERQTAIRAWIDDFLFMTIPTAMAQRRCAGLFRHEVVAPTRFHAEFKSVLLWLFYAPFVPRRKVKLQAEDLTARAREWTTGSRLDFNQKLEDWYNAIA